MHLSRYYLLIYLVISMRYLTKTDGVGRTSHKTGFWSSIRIVSKPSDLAGYIKEKKIACQEGTMSFHLT